MITRLTIAAFTLAIGLAGCVSSHVMAKKQASAIVHGTESRTGGLLEGSVRRVRVMEVDGKPTGGSFFGIPGRVKVPTGRRRLRVGYSWNGIKPSRGADRIADIADVAFAGPTVERILSARDFVIDAEPAASYLLRFDTSTWDSQQVSIWLEDEHTRQIVGSSQTVVRLHGTAYYDPPTPAGFRRGVFVVSIDSTPVKRDLFEPHPLFLDSGHHAIEVLDVSTGWEPPQSTADLVTDSIARLPGIDILSGSYRQLRNGRTFRHHLMFDAKPGAAYLIHFDTHTWDATRGSVWIEDERTAEVMARSDALKQ